MKHRKHKRPDRYLIRDKQTDLYLNFKLRFVPKFNAATFMLAKCDAIIDRKFKDITHAEVIKANRSEKSHANLARYRQSNCRKKKQHARRIARLPRKPVLKKNMVALLVAYKNGEFIPRLLVNALDEYDGARIDSTLPIQEQITELYNWKNQQT
jgi:hypothetical protein